MCICKQDKFQYVHAKQGRDKAGRYSSIWKQQFQKCSSENQNSGGYGKHSQALGSYSSVVSTRLSLMTGNAQFFVGT